MQHFNKTLFLSLSALLSTESLAQTITPDITAANTTYNSEQCSSWLSTAQASDTDASGGLSQDEYYTFLTSIEDPPYINEYFQEYPDFSTLPWTYRVLFTAMTCNCMSLGQGKECCRGADAEAMFEIPNNSTAQEKINTTNEFMNLLCQQIQFLVSQVKEPEKPDVPVETLPPTKAPQGIDESKSTDDIENEPNAATGTVTETNPEEDSSDGLGAGAVVGYAFAVFIPLCAGCFIFLHQRKLEEERRLREFAGEAAKEDALANFDAADAELHPSLEPVIEQKVMTDQQEDNEEEGSNDKNDDSDDGSSVWSDGDGKEKDENEIIVENEDTKKQTVGSALAAMGVASTVATSMIAPTSKKTQNDEDNNSLV